MKAPAITPRKRVEQELAAELANLQRLHELSLQLIREGDVAQLYERLLDAALGIMRSDMATMQVIDEEENALRLLASRGYDRDITAAFGIVRPGDQTCCAMARQGGRRVVVPDVRQCDGIVGPARAAHLAHGIEAVQSTPLVSRDGRLLGMISTHWRAPHVPTERDLRLLDLLARQAADLVERRQAEAAQRRQSEHLQLLWDSASVLVMAANPDAMLRGLFAKIAPHLRVDTYFNHVVDEHRQELRLASYSGVSEDTARTITRLAFGQGVCGAVALRRTPIVATHIQDSADPMVQPVQSFGIRAYACHPLLCDDRLLGTLSFGTRTRDTFDPDELTFFQTISRYVSVAYERLSLVRQLREADRRKDEFLATLAHELRNPLAPIRNSLHILRSADDGDPISRRMHGMMERQVNQLVRLVDDLLDVARITRGQVTLQREPVDLADVLNDAVETSRPLIDGGRHRLSLSLPEVAVLVDGDRARLTQVFANLLNNAAKYTDLGGTITVTVTPQADAVEVAVHDTGRGISAEILPRVFEMFAPGKPETGRDSGGLGIGLSLARKLTELHGGELRASSPGTDQGSTFTVRLPLLSYGAFERRMASSHLDKLPLLRRVLVVDDNRDAADSLGMLLQYRGSDARVVYDGSAALAAMSEYRPTMVLLDIGMPGLDGYEVAARMRQLPEGKDVTLIALTGWGQHEDRRRAERAGFDHHVTKPIDLDALPEILGGGRRLTMQPRRTNFPVADY